jgi:KUP system potassium uptake protein
MGVASLILWSLLLIVSLKYAILIMGADNRGEGGIVALLALLYMATSSPPVWRLAGCSGALRSSGPSSTSP